MLLCSTPCIACGIAGLVFQRGNGASGMGIQGGAPCAPRLPGIAGGVVLRRIMLDLWWRAFLDLFFGVRLYFAQVKVLGWNRVCEAVDQILRKINFSIWDQICPTLDYFQNNGTICSVIWEQKVFTISLINRWFLRMPFKIPQNSTVGS